MSVLRQTCFLFVFYHKSGSSPYEKVAAFFLVVVVVLVVTAVAAAVVVAVQYGSKQCHIETLNYTLSHELGSERVSKRMIAA